MYRFLSALEENVLRERIAHNFNPLGVQVLYHAVKYFNNSLNIEEQHTLLTL